MIDHARVTAFACLAAAAPTLAQAWFQGVGDLAGGDVESEVQGASADGTVAVGWSSVAQGTEAFRWTAEGGIVGLGDAPGGIYWSSAEGVTADGSVLAGFVKDDTDYHAVRWTEQLGWLTLGRPNSHTKAEAITPNGKVIVGTADSLDGDYEAFRWTEDTGNMPLLGVPPGFSGSFAHAVSPDGSVVAGDCFSGLLRWHPFRWTAQGGAELIPELPGSMGGDALGVSYGGEVIVGVCGSLEGSQAFRWSAETGTVGLGDLEGGEFHSVAMSVSADGSVIAGSGRGPENHQEAILWLPDRGIVRIRDMLLEAGVSEVEGWRLESARVTAGGDVVFGRGVNPQGQTEGYVAHLPPLCETDLDGNRTLDLFDFLSFVNLFNAGDLKADFEADGALDLFDFLAFTNAFNAGC